MQATLAAGLLLLLLGSWRLWIPHHLFPRTPLMDPLASLPGWLDSLLTWSMLAALVVVGLRLAMRPQRYAAQLLAWLLLGLLGGMVLLDQHRLQPWCVHIGVALVLVTSLPERLGRRWLINLTASIYIYSAVSKFDAQFLHTVGQEFLGNLLARLSVDARALSEPVRTALAALFPLGELLCGLGLLWPTAQRWALRLSLLMHALLLMVLGPWGLNHSWGVLLWNGLFIAQNLILLRQAIPAAPLPSADWNLAGPLLARALGIIVMIVPLGERWGLTDHWLGWALYAPHSSRAVIEVSQGAIERLPATITEHLSQSDQPGWLRISVDKWSLSALGVSMYPQQRLYVAVARTLASRLDEFELRVVLLSASDRFSGRRQAHQLNGKRQLEVASAAYWWGTASRPMP